MLSYCYHQVHFYKTQWFVFLPAVSDVWTYWIWTPSMSVFLGCQLGMLSVSGPLALLLCFCSLAHWPRLRYIRSSSFGTHAFSERLLFLQQWKKPGRSWQWNDGHGFRTRKKHGEQKDQTKITRVWGNPQNMFQNDSKRPEIESSAHYPDAI